MTNKVVMPLGEMAGKEVDLPHALTGIVGEMQRRRDDLRVQARRQPQEAPALEACINDLERYILALFILWYQTEEPAQRDLQIGSDLADFVRQAQEHNLKMPADLEAQAHRKPQERGK